MSPGKFVIFCGFRKMPCNLQKKKKKRRVKTGHWAIMKVCHSLWEFGVGTVENMRILLIAKGYLPEKESN